MRGRDAKPAPGAAEGGGDAAPVEGGTARPAEPAQGDSAAPTPPLPLPQAAWLYANPWRLRRPAATGDPSLTCRWDADLVAYNPLESLF